MSLEEYSVYLQQLMTCKKDAVVSVVKKVKTNGAKFVSKKFKLKTRK